MKKTISAAAIVALLSAAAFPTLAMAETIHDYDVESLESNLRIDSEDLEEWGGFIRGWTVDAEGDNVMALYDPATLQRVL